MTKERLNNIIDQLIDLNLHEKTLYDIDIKLTGITTKWYNIVIQLLAESFNKSQIDFIICYVYGDLNDYPDLEEIKTFDDFYNFLINIPEYNENEPIEEKGE